MGMGLLVADVPPHSPIKNVSRRKGSRKGKKYMTIEEEDDGVLQVDGNVSLVESAKENVGNDAPEESGGQDRSDSRPLVPSERLADPGHPVSEGMNSAPVPASLEDIQKLLKSSVDGLCKKIDRIDKLQK